MSRPSQVRMSGPLTSFAEGFAAELTKQGYRPMQRRISYSFLRTSVAGSPSSGWMRRRSALRY